LLSAHETTADADPPHSADTPSLSELLSDHPIVSHMPASKASAQGVNLGWWWWWWWWFLHFPSLVRKLRRTWPPRIL
jgi:hypothetical protein